MKLPARLPSIDTAQLPKSYEAARSAIATCEQLDECKTWGDKAAALISYAAQAQDTALLDAAKRIQLRAERRCGELLAQVPPDAGGRPSKTQSRGEPSFTREQTAKAAKLSHRRSLRALQLAKIPESQFEAAVEAETVPSIRMLAKYGARNWAPSDLVRVEQALVAIPPAEHKDALRVVGALGTHPSRMPKMLANLADRSPAGRTRLYALAAADDRGMRQAASLASGNAALPDDGLTPLADAIHKLAGASKACRFLSADHRQRLTALIEDSNALLDVITEADDLRRREEEARYV